MSPLTGVILAGGRSRRFGMDKAFASYGGERFIDRTVRVLKGVFHDVAIVTNDPEKYRDLPATVLTDESPFQGPMGGILTALKRFGDLFVTACDMPLLSREVILTLLQKDDGSSLVLYRHENGVEPLCALYRPALIPLLESRLKSGRRDLRSLVVSGIRVLEVPLEAARRRHLHNVNTLSEMVELV